MRADVDLPFPFRKAMAVLVQELDGFKRRIELCIYLGAEPISNSIYVSYWTIMKTPDR